nr:proteasome activator complex subunit 4 [Arenicola marina]
MDLPNMEEIQKRTDILGFKPQQEIHYNALLPYVSVLDQESSNQLAAIKANLALTIQLRDIKIGASHWTAQLAKYIRLYGHKFSKEDHLTFINILFELTTIPDLDYSLVHKFGQLLVTLLKKRSLLCRDDLTLPWRPLYNLIQEVVYSSFEHLGLVLLPANIETILKNVVKCARSYFPPEATQEMLDEWRPLLCPFDMTMMRGMYFMDLFFPTNLPPELHDQGFKLWFEDLWALYETCQNSPAWEANLVSLFARLAYDTIGYIDWEPYIQMIFTKILRSFNLPVGSTGIQIGSTNNCYDVINSVWWMISMMGGGTTAQSYLDKMLKALESFYHPSNIGKWNGRLMKLIFKLPHSLIRRLHRERHKKTWEPAVPESRHLTDAEVTTFVLSMKPVVFLAMFCKIGSHDSAAAIQHLAALRPEIIIPPLLDKTYPALETLTEPHRLVACLQCLVTVIRPMLASHKWYPDGRSHVIPLLNLCLPGIDPNDVKKCLITFQLVSTIVSLIPIVDCSEAVQSRQDLTEVEKELCFASVQFEDFVLQFTDRVLGLVENSSHEHTRTDSATSERLTNEETMIEVGILSTFNAIMQQSSPKIYQMALQRLFTFVSRTFYEVRVAGRFTADLIRSAVKVNPEKALKQFLMHFCDTIKARVSSEDISQEEHLDNEFLWNLLLLSECVRSNGRALLPYREDLVTVLKACLHLKCKEAADLAGNLLRHVLKALTLIYATDYRSAQTDWSAPFSEQFPIRDWGRSGRVEELEMQWHVPSAEELTLASELLATFLAPELDTITDHVTEKKTLTREQLQRCLTIVLHTLVGAGCALPSIGGKPVQIVQSLVDQTRFNNTASMDENGITMNGEHVRETVAKRLRLLVDHLLTGSEDDTKSLNLAVRLYSCVMYFQGTQKEDFDGRWKSLHIVKKAMENKLIGKKSHIRALLVDRVQLQHELRVINRVGKAFTLTHKELFADLLRLSVSRYSEVRRTAQNALSQGFYLFAYSYRVMLEDILGYLDAGADTEHHQFKGALYVIYGEGKRSLVTKRSWDVMLRVWPALVKAKESEKPSILRIMDDIADKLHKNIESTELAIKVHPSLLDASAKMWTNGSAPQPLLPSAGEEEVARGLSMETARNDEYRKHYFQLVDTLVDMLERNDLRWKFQQMSLEMLGLLIRHDVKLPAGAVDVFVKSTIHETLQIRKIAIASLSGILKQQKRKHPMEEVDPYSQVVGDANGERARAEAGLFRPGDRPDTTWHHYDTQTPLDSQEVWDKCVFVEKTHWGYYTWPRSMKVYSKRQPPVDRALDDLPDEEKPIHQFFSDADHVEKLLRYMSLEGHKGRDKFHSKHFTLFKGLFRNFGDSFLAILKPHVERMVADTKPETHEYQHRLAAEIASGLIRGSKHWDYPRIRSAWDWLIPVLKKALSNISVESVADWGTCFATSSESRDPRRLAPMLELLMDDPMRGEGGSFGDASRLYVLQGALAQQEWRVPGLLHRFLQYSQPHMAHTYKNVRDRLGSILVNVFLYDVQLRQGAGTSSPTRAQFILDVVKKLQVLRESHPSNGPGNGSSNASSPGQDNGLGDPVVAMAIDSASPGDTPSSCSSSTATPSEQETGAASSGDIKLQMLNDPEKGSLGTLSGVSFGEESPEHKEAVRLCKTVLKWMEGCFSRMFQCLTPEMFELLPIMCLLESEIQDDELRHECKITLAFLSKTLLSADVIPVALETIDKVASLNSWHARKAILSYLQVLVFNNLFLLQAPEVKADIQRLVIKLLCDDQIEVREVAAITLGGFLHCGYMDMDDTMMSEFQKLSSTTMRKNKKRKAELLTPEQLTRRHAGVLGLSACVQAYPYDVPQFIPQVLMDLSDHLDDPQPIQMTVKKTLSNFKRTHYDNWQDHKQQFTDDQLVVLTELLVSPNYYA